MVRVDASGNAATVAAHLSNPRLLPYACHNPPLATHLPQSAVRGTPPHQTSPDNHRSPGKPATAIPQSENVQNDEQILVIPSKVIESIGTIDGFEPDVDRFLQPILQSPELSFQPRSVMESDPSFKQLIPYVVMQYNASDGPRLFRYSRGGGGGETRLHAKFSIGIGGHVSAEDAEGPGDVYQTGMQREIDEEVTIGTTYATERLGLIYDNTTEVGRVHLGVVHRFLLDAPEITSNEADLADGRFVDLRELNAGKDRLETWSQLVLDHVL